LAFNLFIVLGKCPPSEVRIALSEKLSESGSRKAVGSNWSIFNFYNSFWTIVIAGYPTDEAVDKMVLKKLLRF